MRNDFYHALKVDNELCYGCTHCMMACPTAAIRIENGKAVIIDERCIDCGECMKACPVDAIYVEQDDFKKIFNSLSSCFLRNTIEDSMKFHVFICCQHIIKAGVLKDYPK